MPSQAGVLGAFGALFAAADLAFRGAWFRMKIGKNLSCPAGFFDETRNCAGFYSHTGCTSQVSQRAYRSRLKSA
ncbi:hypothetical protein J2853_002763 [Streptosporangium lutulentum]|uniref:Uncharacterized protein n=1 Tax=Streptosporangium lutulentum TaxID=1461250 RepID=A0ABT9Q9X4_9ACTN|nr:hypothetical protein [Streptosporangium lutulentum]